MELKIKKDGKVLKITGIVVAVIAVIFCGFLISKLVQNIIRGDRIAVDSEYTCDGECDWDFLNLEIDNYEKLINDKRNFIMVVDQEGCDTADRIKSYVLNYAYENKIRIHRIMFEKIKETPLHEKVKYYPSIVVFSKGEPIGWLRADSDEDANAYNDEKAFREWLSKYVR